MILLILFDSGVGWLGSTQAASFFRSVYQDLYSIFFDRCRLTTGWIPEPSRSSFMQKFCATPKANSDVFSTPSSQEPCLQNGTKRTECSRFRDIAIVAVLAVFPWAAFRKPLHDKGGLNSYQCSKFKLPPETTNITEDRELYRCSRGSASYRSI